MATATAPSEQAILAAYKVKKRLELKAKLRGRYEQEPVDWIQERAKGYMYSKLRDIAYSVRDNRRTAVPSAHEVGKALDIETLLPTPTGWITMKDARIGTVLYDELGQECTVVNISDIEERETCKITFSDSSHIIAADNHQWNVLDLRTRKRHVKDWRNHWNDSTVITTEVLQKQLKTSIGQLRWKIPTTKALIGIEREWPFRWDAYTYGAWLGDGTTVRWEITCHVDDSEHMAGMTGGVIKIPNGRPQIAIINPPGRATLDCPTRVYGVDKKFIPQLMLRTDREYRLGILRGLMDTDGMVTHNAGVQIDLSDKELAEQVRELIVSLGWVVSVKTRIPSCNGKDGKMSYRMHFTPDENVFTLPRKSVQWEILRGIQPISSKTTQRTIVSIESVGLRQVKCVEVDSDRHLYLAGKSMIPTHNSWLSARLASWWIDSSAPGEAFVITTAPGNKQVKAVLWKEMHRVYVTANLAGRMNQTEWWVNGEMVAMGRKPSNYDPTAFQGIHAKKVLLILDEACGITEEIYIAGNSLIANEFGRMLAIGNPDDPDSHFAKICRPNSGWNVIPISAFDTPNFTKEDAPQAVKDVLISPIYVEEMVRDVGIDSAVYVSKILGQFPENKADGVIPLSFIRRCQIKDLEEDEDLIARYARDDRENILLPVELGMDVGAGGDETSIRERRGILAYRYWEGKTPEPEQAFAIAVQAIMETGATRIKIDSIGIGWGVIGMLRQASIRGHHYNEILEQDINIEQCEIVGVNVGQASTDPTRFPRLRDQLWWEIGRGLSETKGWDLTLLDDKTVEELISPTWHPDLANRHKIETKLEMMKRTSKKSPNRADALMLAYIEPPTEEVEALVVYNDPITTGPNY